MIEEFQNVKELFKCDVLQINSKYIRKLLR